MWANLSKCPLTAPPPAGRKWHPEQPQPFTASHMAVTLPPGDLDLTPQESKPNLSFYPSYVFLQQLGRTKLVER